MRHRENHSGNIERNVRHLNILTVLVSTSLVTRTLEGGLINWNAGIQKNKRVYTRGTRSRPVYYFKTETRAGYCDICDFIAQIIIFTNGWCVLSPTGESGE